MSSSEIAEIEGKQPFPPVENEEEPFADFYRTVANHTKNIEFYVEPGSRLEKVSEGVLVTPPIFPNRVFYWKKEDLANKVFENPYHDSFVKSQEPSYLLPASPALRTGRRRDLHRRTDTGKHQRRRWRMDEIENDIPRGNWTYSNDIYKEMLDSIDWEREWPHPQDMNYYKRSHVSTLLGDNDRNEDSYWDPQYIGGVDTYPRVLLAGMNFTWNVFWVPWLCKKHPRKGGTPLKSELFNLGGIEPLQVTMEITSSMWGLKTVISPSCTVYSIHGSTCFSVLMIPHQIEDNDVQNAECFAEDIGCPIWFYPDGCETSHPGFCAVKLVSRPGWNLPYKINIWIKGSTVAIPCRLPEALDSRTTFSQRQNQHLTTEKGRYKVSSAEVETSENSNKERSTQPYRVFRSCVHLGPINREEADYVAYSYSFCSFTNSDMFENYKYRDVPDKHFAKYLPSNLPPALEGDEFEQAALNRRHAY